MKFVRYSIFLLWAFLETSAAHACSLKDGSKNASCFCDTDVENGWSYTCIDKYYFDPLYSVQWIQDHSVIIQCGENQPDLKSILKQLNLERIQLFSFKSCYLPNTSYSDLIPYQEKYPVNRLQIDLKRDNRTFDSEVFGNISTELVNLILNQNNIDFLPESIFDNFTKLAYLSLSQNERLKTLPPNIFSHTKNLKMLEITYNALESLPEDFFQNTTSLVKLYLYKNKLTSLPEGLFRNLKDLKVLDLADNNIMSLPSGIFSDLTNLIHVRLRANWLTTLPEHLFNNTINMQDMDLSLNGFVEPLPEELFYSLSHLGNLILSNCNLSQIYENFFSRCVNLTFLNLEQNSLTFLPENIFANNSLLKEINLNFNMINELPYNLLPNHMFLEKVSFGKNNISVIPSGFFRKARRVKSLILAANRLQNATQGIFKDIPKLEMLDLSFNNLTAFQLDTNDVIRRIDLAHNEFTEMPYIQWTYHLQIEMFSIAYNMLEYISIPILYPSTKRNPVLNFRNNNIKVVNVETIALNDHIIKDLSPKDYDSYVETRVIISSNPLVCDCQNYPLYEYIRSRNVFPKKTVRFDMVQNLTCEEPKNLNGKPLMSLIPEQFICELKNQCPKSCHCYTKAEDQTNIVDCSNQKLSTLPILVPNNINVLMFQGNLLRNMSGFNKEQWENLTELYLDNNQITSLNNWSIPTNLKNLSLAGNHLESLPSFFIDFVSKTENFHLFLKNNSFICNCSTISFKKWLADHYKVIKDVQQIVCANPVVKNDTHPHPPILTTPDAALCPKDDRPYKLHLITVTSICVLLALLLIIVLVLYYRNKQTVIAYVYIHMHYMFTCFFSEEEMDEDKKFDAFLAYSSSDRDIALRLLQELEEKPPHFSLCIHERNWIAGNQISWNIFNSVHSSRKTIIIVSKEFLESMWFHVEFRTAYYQMLEDKIDRLIIIVKGELPPKESLDKDLLYLLSTKTYLVWEEKWFWEKLKYAMPHKKHHALPSDVLALKDRPPTDKIKPVDTQISILSSSTQYLTENDQNQTNAPITNSAFTAENTENSTREPF